MKEWFKTYANGTTEIKTVASTPISAESKTKLDQHDLSYIKSIYLSTGANLNDDEFLPEEVNLALHTIANKPINKEHVETDIVGHMLNAYTMDKENKQTASLDISIDKWFLGMTSKSNNQLNNHDHDWTLAVGADGKLIRGYTTWDNGHRHIISPYSVKNATTDPGDTDNHTHILQGLDPAVQAGIVVASADGMPDMTKKCDTCGTTDKCPMCGACTNCMKDTEDIQDTEDPMEEMDASAKKKQKKMDKHMEMHKKAKCSSVPEDFHVVTEGVLYKGIHNKYVNEVQTKAKNGKAFVSMETYFNNYDYRIGKDLIKRNESTAFLDQYLRVNGGTGEFDGSKVTRVLRNLHFAGKGIVETPANPPSIIFASKKNEENVDKKNLWEKIKSNRVEYIEEDKSLNKVSVKEDDNKIGDNVMEVKELETKLAAAEKSVSELDVAVKAKDTEIATLKESVTSLTAKVEAANKEVAETKTSLVAAESKLTEIKLAQVVATRKLDFASFDISEDDLKEILDEIKSMDDAAYAKYVAKAKRLFKAKVAEAKTETKVAEAKVSDEDKAKEAEKAIESALANKNVLPLQGSVEVDNNKVIASKVAESIFGKKEKK